jgi:hypothetical protein
MVVKSHRKSAGERAGGWEKRADWRDRSAGDASSGGVAVPALRIVREKAISGQLSAISFQQSGWQSNQRPATAVAGGGPVLRTGRRTEYEVRSTEQEAGA